VKTTEPVVQASKERHVALIGAMIKEELSKFRKRFEAEVAFSFNK
jgi:hypothetical protein